MFNFKVSLRKRSVDQISPLSRGVTEAVAVYVRQRRSVGSVGVATILAQHPEALAPMVLTAIDELAGRGMVGVEVSACGTVGIAWRGHAGVAA